MKTRPIFFDVDGVLIDGYHARPGERQHRWDKNLLADFGVDPERFKTEFIYDVFVKKVIIGKMALIDALDRVLPSLGYKGSSMEFVQYWLANDSHVIEPILTTLKQVRAKTAAPLFIATNQEHLRAHWLWHTLGFNEVFDDIFYSARLGVIKPNPAYFAAIEQRLGSFAEQPLFFDDTPDVITSARAAGWDAVLVETDDDVLQHPEIMALLN